MCSNNNNRRVLLILAPLLSLFWVCTAQAIPAWAKQYEKDCSSCHAAWPQLNKTGREFKENGYRMEDQIGEKVEHDSIPWGINFIGRPYDKQDIQNNPADDTRIRALHEVELFMGGAIDDQFSGYFEIEFEDEIDNNSFGSEINPAMMAWNANPAFNLQAVWGDAFFADSYGFLRNQFKLTRGDVQTGVRTFGGTDGAISATRQSVSAYGRVAKRLFYLVGLSGEDEDALGIDASNLHARLAVDITDNIMIGGVAVEGEVCVDPACTTSLKREYSRYGAEAQIDLGGSRINLAYITAEDDVSATTQVDNDAYSVQWYHAFQTEGGKPTFVPLVRFDQYETNNGTLDFEELTVNLTYYFRENVKAHIEYWDRQGPTSAQDRERLTLQAFVAF